MAPQKLEHLLAAAYFILSILLSAASSYKATESQQRSFRREPPIYKIQTSYTDRNKWNNHQLEVREPAPRYTDEPVPYFHSYKLMGRPLGDDHMDVMQASARGRPRNRARAGTKGGSSKGGAPSRWPPARQPGEAQSPIWPSESSSESHSEPSLNSSLVNVQRRVGGAQASKKNLVCYYGTWAVYRPDAGKYPVENIDPFLCTHIIYGFTGLSYDNLIKPLDPWNDLEDNYGKGAMKRFTNLKRTNPDLKTLVAIGGWNEGSIKYSKMASEPESRARFVQSVLDFLKKYNFDGLDLDWEYPGARGGYSYDKQNFVKLLRELKQAFEPYNYLLTAAVSAGKWFIDPAYDIGQVSKYLDLINLMAYDYHGGWETKTGMNAPLFHSPKHDVKDETMLNVNWSVNYWLQQGAPPEKIMLGVGSYGRSFTLDKSGVNGINAPASQKGRAGPYTREPGSLGYNEICEAFMRQPQAWTIVRDPDYMAPYAYNNERQWVGYDDMDSLALKTQYAKSMGLGGMMMWSIETDDFLGKCHQEKYPLLNTIKRVMNGSQKPSSRPVEPRPSKRPASSTSSPSTPAREIEDDVVSKPPATTSTSTTRRPTTARAITSASRRPTSSSRRPWSPSSSARPASSTSPASATSSTGSPSISSSTKAPPSQAEFVCRADGMFSDPSNCRKFIRCVSSGSMYSLFRFDCGPGTAFNEQFQYCDHIHNVPKCAHKSPAQSDGYRLELAHRPPLVFYW